MLQIEKVRAMPDGLQLRGHGAHDGHHGAALEPIVDGAQRVDPRHDSSHMRSRVKSSATGLFDEYASACACRI